MKKSLLALLLCVSPAFAVEITISENTGADHTGVTDTEIRDNFSERSVDHSANATISPSSFVENDTRKVLINFASPSLGGTVTVSSAVLRIYQTASGGGSLDYDINAMLLASVPSQATYDDAATGLPWNGVYASASGSDFTVLGGETFTDTTGEYKEFNDAGLASWVQTHLNLGTPIRFLITRDPVNAYDSNYGVFASSEGSDGQRPELVINYTVNSGSLLLRRRR